MWETMRYGVKIMCLMGIALFLLATDSFAAQKVEIRWNMQIDPEEMPLYEMAIHYLEKDHPNIKIKKETVGWADTVQKLTVAAAGGKAPDLTFVGAEWTNTLGGKGLLAPLNKYIERDYKEMDFDDFYKAPVKCHTSFDGKTYALPFTAGNVQMFYNKEIFDESGIPYPDETWTWNTMRKVGKKLAKDTNNDGEIDQWLASTVLFPSDMWGASNFQIWVGGVGADIFNEDFTRVNLTQPEVTKVTQWLADLYLKDHILPPPPALVTGTGVAGFDPWLAGKTAISLSNPPSLYLYRERCDFDWDVALFPIGWSGERYNRNFTGGWAMCAYTEHPEEAWTALKTMVSARSVGLYRTIPGTGLPVRKVLTSLWLRVHAPKNAKVFIEGIEHGDLSRDYNRTPYWIPLANVLKKEMQLVQIGEKSAEEGLRDAEKEMNKVLKEELARLGR